MLVIYRHVPQAKGELQVPMLAEAHRIAVAQTHTPVIALIAAEIPAPLYIKFSSVALQGEVMPLKDLLARSKPPPQFPLRIEHLESILVPVRTCRPPREHKVRIGGEILAERELKPEIDSSYNVSQQVRLRSQGKLGNRPFHGLHRPAKVRLRAAQAVPEHLQRLNCTDTGPYAKPGGAAQLLHIVALEILPSVAVIQLLYSPLARFLTYSLRAQNPEQLVPVLPVVILLHELGKAWPVLRKRAYLNLALIQLRAVRSKFQEKLLCSSGTLFGQLFVVRVASLGRSPGIDGNAVDMRRIGQIEAYRVYRGSVVQVG